MSYQSTIHGIDRTYVEAIMRKARRERNKAIHQFFARMFKRSETPVSTEADCGCAAPAAR